MKLGAGEFGIDLEFTSHGIAGGIVALREDAVATAVQAAAITPNHHITTISQSRNLSLGLSAGGGSIDQSGITQRLITGIKLLFVDAGSAPIGGFPGDHVTTTRQSGHHRYILIPDGRITDLKFRTEAGARPAETLREDTVAAAILILRGPDQDIAAIGQRAYDGLILITTGVEVHLAFIKGVVIE